VFNSGKAAMALTHLWYTCCLTDAGGKWDVAVVPAHNGKITSNFNADTFRIMKDSKHPDEAFTVLSYLLNEASAQLLDAYDALPAQKEAQADFFKIRDEQFPQKVDWPVFLDMIAYADNPSFEGYMPNYNESFDLAATFLSKLYTTEGLNLDDEIAKFKSDLQTTFDK
jgi:multiple sugar transport system substrate-binding protein